MTGSNSICLVVHLHQTWAAWSVQGTSPSVTVASLVWEPLGRPGGGARLVSVPQAARYTMLGMPSNKRKTTKLIILESHAHHVCLKPTCPPVRMGMVRVGEEKVGGRGRFIADQVETQKGWAWHAACQRLACLWWEACSRNVPSLPGRKDTEHGRQAAL